MALTLKQFVSPMATRRAFAFGLAAVAATAVLAANGAPALAQSGAKEVPLEKLLAKGPLEDLSIGKKDAKVTIVEYASLTCGHCANFHNKVFPDLKKKYVDTGKVRFIYREFPLDNLALAASMVGRCLSSTDKAMSFTSVLFKNPRAWITRNPVDDLFAIAKQAGFTRESYNKCLEDNALAKKIIEQREIASKEFGVDATPTFFINGKPLNTRSDTIKSFEAVLDPLLKSDAS